MKRTLLIFASSLSTAVAALADTAWQAPPFVDLNFGLIEIDWEGGTVTLSAAGQDGEIAIRHELKIPGQASLKDSI
jgi:hypothetical protein